MVLASINSGAYKALVALHLVCVVGGFGPFLFSSLYLSKAVHRRVEGGLAIAVASFEASQLALYLVYLAPIFGLAALGASSKTYKFSQAWVSASLALYIVWVGVYHAVVRPGHRKLNAALAAGAPDSEVAAINARLAPVTGVLHLVLVAVIVLMVWKPGY